MASRVAVGSLSRWERLDRIAFDSLESAGEARSAGVPATLSRRSSIPTSYPSPAASGLVEIYRNPH